jgi:hypothetical protein
MKRCPECNRTFDDIQSFCVVDGAPLSAPFDPQATLQLPGTHNANTSAKENISSNVIQNSSQQSRNEIASPFSKGDQTETNNSRRTIYIVVVAISVLLIGGLIYLATRPSTGGGAGGQQRLEEALRAGTPEFEQYRDRIVLDGLEATEATRAIGDIVMTLKATVRNFTGRTITGLEVHAAVVDSQGQPVKERTVIVIPTRQPELEPNKTMEVPVMLEGMKKEDDRANIKMEVTAVTFK